VDLFHVLFGSVLALDDATLILIAAITTLTLLTLALLFRPLVAECVDPAFLRAVSRTSAPVHFTFLALVVLNLVAGFQALGTLLAVGMAILPAAAARFWVREIGALLAVAVLLGLLGSVLGLLGFPITWGLPRDRPSCSPSAACTCSRCSPGRGG
jgi:zinc/manganese transport system permease protein